MGQLWNLSGRTALATLAGLAVLEGYTVPAWAGPRSSEPSPITAAVVANSSGRVSVDFVEADLGDVVKALSIQSGVNVVLAADTKGKVSVRLKGTTLEEALRLITSRLENFDFKRINGAYVLGTTDSLRNLARRSGVSQTVTLRSLQISDAKEVAQGASAYVEVTAQPRTNQLVLRGLPEDVAAARAAVEAAESSAGAATSTRVVSSAKLSPRALADLLLNAMPELKCSVRERGVVVTGSSTALALADDVVRTADLAGGFPQVTRVYPLRYLNPATAITFFQPGQAAALAAATPVQQASTSGVDVSGTPAMAGSFPHLIVRAGPEALAPTAGSFKPLSLDSAKTFGSAQATSSEPSSGGAAGGAAGAASPKARTLIMMGPEDEVTAATALLDQLDVAPPQVMIEARVVEASPEALKNIGLQWDFGTSGLVERPHGGVNVGQLTRPPISFSATINALIQNQNAKVLAEPKIAVLDGEDASIFIGDTIRYRVLSSVSTGGQQVFDVKEVPVGIVLLVRPRVNANGMITLKVNPVVSSITAFVGPEQLPQTASREANSTIRVHDGDTVAIGGLIRDEDRQTFSKVPILGDLPIVGQLFRNNNHDRKRTDVTIFLTTHLLKG
jgi:type II secretory pathway component GspD/PulD (secretin)